MLLKARRSCKDQPSRVVSRGRPHDRPVLDHSKRRHPGHQPAQPRCRNKYTALLAGEKATATTTSRPPHHPSACAAPSAHRGYRASSSGRDSLQRDTNSPSWSKYQSTPASLKDSRGIRDCDSSDEADILVCIGFWWRSALRELCWWNACKPWPLLKWKRCKVSLRPQTMCGCTPVECLPSELRRYVLGCYLQCLAPRVHQFSVNTELAQPLLQF